jgi:hypothetical protein
LRRPRAISTTKNTWNTINDVYRSFNQLIGLIGAFDGGFRCIHGGEGGFHELSVPRDADKHETAKSIALIPRCDFVFIVQVRFLCRKRQSDNSLDSREHI